jgi:hypothetical protein
VSRIEAKLGGVLGKVSEVWVNSPKLLFSWPTFLDGFFVARDGPFVELHVDAALGHLNALGFEEFSLQGGVGFADEEFPARAQNAMPGNSPSGRTTGHGATCGSCAARQAQRASYCPVG